MAYVIEENGPITPNVVFGFLCLLLTLLFQREHAQHCYVLPMQKNAARMFALAPWYTLMILLTAYLTPVKPLWDISMAIIDGYALYAFLALVVMGAGGKDKVIAHFDAFYEKSHTGDLVFPVWFCIPVHFKNANSLYLFLKRSVIQVMVTRPVMLGASAIAERAFDGRLAHMLTRLFRVAALAFLVYAVMTIARVYHLVRKQVWSAFNPVASFMVVKGFILLITVQDFIISMIFSARDPYYRMDATRAGLAAYSLVVSVEALVYLVMLRQTLHYKIFSSYSSQAARPMVISTGEFLEETYKLTNVFGGDLPPIDINVKAGADDPEGIGEEDGMSDGIAINIMGKTGRDSSGTSATSSGASTH